MSELVCPWCGRVSPMGSTACGACGASLKAESTATPEQTAPQTSPEPEVPEVAAAEPPPPEPVVQAPVRAQAASAAPAATPPPVPAVVRPQPAPAPPAASGGTPAISDLVPCPNPGCFGVVAPGDTFCTFCGQRLPAAPAPVSRPGPPPLGVPPTPPGPKPAGGGFHIPRGVWVVLSIIPLGLCGLIAALVLNAVGAPPDVFDPKDLPAAQKEAEAVAWPSGTPTRAPTATSTTTPTPSVTPTVTRTGTAGAGPTARSGTPTMTPDPGWKPAPLTLGKGAATVPVAADNLYSGVTIYMLETNGTSSYVYEVMGGSDSCKSMSSGRGVMLRRYDGIPYWVDRTVLVNYLTRPSANPVTIRADDPGLKAKQWVTYPCPQ